MTNSETTIYFRATKYSTLPKVSAPNSARRTAKNKLSNTKGSKK